MPAIRTKGPRKVQLLRYASRSCNSEQFHPHKAPNTRQRFPTLGISIAPANRASSYSAPPIVQRQSCQFPDHLKSLSKQFRFNTWGWLEPRVRCTCHTAWYGRNPPPASLTCIRQCPDASYRQPVITQSQFTSSSEKTLCATPQPSSLDLDGNCSVMGVLTGGHDLGRPPLQNPGNALVRPNWLCSIPCLVPCAFSPSEPWCLERQYSFFMGTAGPSHSLGLDPFQSHTFLSTLSPFSSYSVQLSTFAKVFHFRPPPLTVRVRIVALHSSPRTRIGPSSRQLVRNHCRC